MRSAVSSVSGCPGGADTRRIAAAMVALASFSIRVSTMTVCGFRPSLINLPDTRTVAPFESTATVLAYNPGPP